MPWAGRVGEEDSVLEKVADAGVQAYLGALVPGQRPPVARIDSGKYLQQSVTDLLSSVVSGQVHELDAAAGSVDQGADSGTVQPAVHEVAFPIAQTAALLDDGQAFVDEQRRRDEARVTKVHGPSPVLEGSTGTQFLLGSGRASVRHFAKCRGIIARRAVTRPRSES